MKGLIFGILRYSAYWPDSSLFRVEPEVSCMGIMINKLYAAKTRGIKYR